MPHVICFPVTVNSAVSVSHSSSNVVPGTGQLTSPDCTQCLINDSRDIPQLERKSTNTANFTNISQHASLALRRTSDDDSIHYVMSSELCAHRPSPESSFRMRARTPEPRLGLQEPHSTSSVVIKEPDRSGRSGPAQGFRSGRDALFDRRV